MITAILYSLTQNELVCFTNRSYINFLNDIQPVPRYESLCSHFTNGNYGNLCLKGYLASPRYKYILANNV